MYTLLLTSDKASKNCFRNRLAKFFTEAQFTGGVSFPQHHTNALTHLLRNAIGKMTGKTHFSLNAHTASNDNTFGRAIQQNYKSFFLRRLM